ncbi:MAG: alginate lyase family protein [Acidobacteriota bacterium]
MPNSSDHPATTRSALLSKGIRSVLGGRVGFGRATREAFRRGRAVVQSRRERVMLDELASQPARLRPEFQSLALSDLLNHFRGRSTPSFLPGFQKADSTAARQRELFPDETARLIQSAWTITRDHRWPLLGYGEKEFGVEINWHCDPLSGRIWPLDYHGDIALWHSDGSDIRVLWELNRFGHFITLGRAYALTKEEAFATEFFAQVEGWREQNPVGRGANWSCAMEVALRAMNLLTAFSLFRASPELNEGRLRTLLTMFDQHGAHIRRNLEFSHLATSNHYLSDIAGLLWLGVMLPELEPASEWSQWALKELLAQMDQQILTDGADYEGSTGYHRFVLELLLYSFILCRANEITIEDSYWRKLYTMLEYLRTYLRPDGFAPLIGDTDGGQLLPIVAREANDHAYLLALGAAVFEDAQFKLVEVETPPELLWVAGEKVLRAYELLPNSAQEVSSQTFPDAGTYILRHEDLFLLLNTNGGEKGRPTSHQHNDLLSIEVSAGGRAFIVDPGTYVYTADLRERQVFRSTAYHSTVQIDDEEQQTIRVESPFVCGGEASAHGLIWESSTGRDQVVAEHSGYERLDRPVKHRRAITFDKINSWWLIEDELLGTGEHKVVTRFHFDVGLEATLSDHDSVMARDNETGACLLVRPLGLDRVAELEGQFTSRHYGSKSPSISAVWTIVTMVPCKLRWAIVPVRMGEDQNERLSLVNALHLTSDP